VKGLEKNRREAIMERVRIKKYLLCDNTPQWIHSMDGDDETQTYTHNTRCTTNIVAYLKISQDSRYKYKEFMCCLH
jgi:hypothetical protein